MSKLGFFTKLATLFAKVVQVVEAIVTGLDVAAKAWLRFRTAPAGA